MSLSINTVILSWTGMSGTMQKLCAETKVHDASKHIGPFMQASRLCMSGTSACRLVLALTRNSELRLATVGIKICNNRAGVQKAVHKQASQGGFAHALAANNCHMRAASLPHGTHYIFHSLHSSVPLSSDHRHQWHCDPARHLVASHQMHSHIACRCTGVC